MHTLIDLEQSDDDLKNDGPALVQENIPNVSDHIKGHRTGKDGREPLGAIERVSASHTLIIRN